ncbi:eukaryotic translation initiation factor 5A [Clavispora lusitaniae ATCC 42720]|uniref:eIF-4D n=1 Tax=Clavispora lusitaniae (strain ATCC 42720) TaxID=306902 RepID=C4YCB3_CLAL4|nr:eukaryotic translation initiation factor 5A [Clavispora lusitaniae ATCC 42720]EEQ41624.1 eukaryotic translation initiation factor 5A [Clavispora lusitaniae ATCC 42720]
MTADSLPSIQGKSFSFFFFFSPALGFSIERFSGQVFRCFSTCSTVLTKQHTFETADAGAALTFPMQCSALRKNGHVVIKGRPCKIIDMSTSKTGKHGHAKVHLVATDIFTGKKLEDLSPSTHNMEVPNVTRAEYQLLDIDDGFLSLMTNDGDTKDDVKIPDGELGDKIQADFDEGKDLIISVISAMGEEAAISHKEAPKS